MSAQLVRLATAVLTSEKGRKTVGWVLAAILSPVILLVAFLCCVGSGTAEHNGAVVSAAFYGTELSESVPTEYRAQLTQMRGSFAHLDAAVAEVNQKSEGNSLDPIQVKAVFFVLCFGEDALSQADAEAFAACFYETETRAREETDETYEVAVPLPMEEVYAQLSVWRGRAVTAEERSNAVKIYSMVMGSAGSGTFNGAYEPGGNAPMELEASMFTDPATKNSADLAIYAASAWNSGWGYVWGTFGQVLTPKLLQYKISQYPEGVGDEADFIRSHWLNRRTTDCVGLIKGYGWLNTETMEIQYGSNGMPDVGADGMYYNAGRKGSMQDVSTAVYRAAKKQLVSGDVMLQKLLECLNGKEITSAGHLSARNFSFGEEIIESDGKLNFYLQADFDVDAAFGTFVCTDQNDDWLNIYANYDIEKGRPCDTLELNLCKGDGTEENWSYHLNAAEQEVLARKMEDYCQQQTGMSLHEYAQQLRESGSQTPEMQM